MQGPEKDIGGDWKLQANFKVGEYRYVEVLLRLSVGLTKKVSYWKSSYLVLNYDSEVFFKIKYYSMRIGVVGIRDQSLKLI